MADQQPFTYSFETLSVSSPSEFVKHVQLSRPDKRNAMNDQFWNDMIACFTKLKVDPDCRVIVLSGQGKMFCAGLDLGGGIGTKPEKDASRQAFRLKYKLEHVQMSMSIVEKCNKPVIVAMHNACIGGAIDLACACDIRYCTQDAWFTVKEVDIGLAADIGTLQRFPKIVGNDSLCRELIYTCRRFDAKEAKEIGFVSRVFKDQEEMLSSSLALAKLIASKSPVAVQGSKHNIVYSRDHGVYDGLNYVGTWNASMLQTGDVLQSMAAQRQKKAPTFSKL